MRTDRIPTEEAAGGRIFAAAVSGLEAVSCRMSLDDYLDYELVCPEYRRTVSDLLFHIFRRKQVLLDCIRANTRKPPAAALQNVLLTILAQVTFQSGIARESALNIAVEYTKQNIGSFEGKFVNALVRNVLRSGGVPLSDAPEKVLPSAVLKRWKQRFSPSGLAELVDAFLTPPEFTFRAERDVPSPAGCENVSASGRFRFFRTEKPGDILGSKELADGKFYIQDPATSLAPSLPDYSSVKNALDLCAAPGGKSLMIGEQLNSGAMLTAADRSARRQKLTQKNFELRNLPWRLLVADAASVEGQYDLILADVPCSNTGVFRRRPDALWRFSGSELAEVMHIQREILKNIPRLLLPGGQFVYSTCSIEEQENHLQVEYFLKQHPDFTLKTEKQLYPSLEHDGAYAALLVRK
ncbi:MAG: RsmB/NOP family class I SAM-dependent RNA methyltransferase [Lentisphaeria bacterium]|nr:RsmB/NOP family class I SAM-dependent RNA methyltransferase [Lentisphaeria bacterium]